MRLPQVENGAGLGPSSAGCGRAPGPDPCSTRCRRTLLNGAGSVQVELTSVEPTACGCAGRGRVTHPAEVAVRAAGRAATVQSQILTVCCGRLVVRAVHGGRRSPCRRSSCPCKSPSGSARRPATPAKPAYQSVARAVRVTLAAWVAAAVPSWPRTTVQVVIPRARTARHLHHLVVEPGRSRAAPEWSRETGSRCNGDRGGRRRQPGGARLGRRRGLTW